MLLARLPNFAGDLVLDKLIFLLSVALLRGLCNHNHWDAVFPFFLVKSLFPFGPHGTKILVHSRVGDNWYNKTCFLCCVLHH